MEDLYDDLENYNEVDLVNELKTQNSELKQKLGECLSSMDTLQKDFDKLSSEFKILEINYSSLLKIARAEIKRKTDMITNLNIEKDMLVLKQYNAGGRKKQFDVNNTQNTKRGRNHHKVKGLKQSELNRKECDRLPSEASSTTTDRSNRLTIVENRNLSKPNENLGEDVFPDSGDYHSERFLDKRVSMLTSHQFTKFSSDEEFEDMYSALEPKESSKETSVRNESDRSRKRMRDDPQPSKTYYDTFAAHDKHPSYSEPYRENTSRNRNSRYYDNDRGIHRDRDEYDLSRSHRNKHSPDRHRRGRRDQEEDRPVLQRERQRRLESPPRGRHQHRSRERQPHPDRERTDQKPEMLRYSHSDPHIMIRNIHGEYDEPLNKRQRVEHYPNPVPGEDRRKIDRQFLHDQPPAELVDRRSCQSPDNFHTEYIPSNEPIREIRSEAIGKVDDPRVSSRKYKKDSIGNKDVLCTVSSNEIILQPVNKILWQLEKVKQQQLPPRPTYQISADLVNEIYMDIDNHAPIALEPNYDDDVTDCQDESNKNQTTTDLSPVAKNDKNERDKSVPKHAKDINNVEEQLKSVKYKIPKIKKADKKDSLDELSAKTSSKTDKADKVTHRSKHIEALQGNHHNLDKNTESIIVHHSSKSLEEKLENMSLPELQTLKAVTNVTIQREFEHKVYSVRHIVEGDLELSDETNDETLTDVKVEKASQKKSRTRKKSHRDTSKEKISDAEVNNRKTRSKKEKEKERKCDKFSDLFGDSSSLITPEELALATAQAHAEPHGGLREGAEPYGGLRDGAEPYGAVGEDAQHAIHPDPARDTLPNLTPVILSEPDNQTTNIDVQIESSKEDTRKTKASKDHKTRTHSKHKKVEHTRNESVKVRKDKIASTDEEHKQVNHVPGTLKLTIKTSGFREKFDKKSNNANKPAKKSNHVEETNVSSLSNNKNKSVDETLLSTKPTMDCLSNKDATMAEFKKSVSPIENKENASCDPSKGGNNDMPQFFNETLVPDENISLVNKGNEEKQVQTICSARTEHIPNLVPDKDEQELVKTVVISTGVQPTDPTLYQLSTTESTPLKALATSTPAKELYALNSFNETGSNMNAENGKATINESGGSQNHIQDAPDIRINYYRRRRKAVKKENSS